MTKTHAKMFDSTRNQSNENENYETPFFIFQRGKN